VCVDFDGGGRVSELPDSLTVLTGMLLAATLVAGPTELFAQSADATAVLSFGGVTTVDLYDLDETETTIRSLGTKVIVDQTIGAVEVDDIKILSNGSQLLANAGNRGAIVTDSDGALVSQFPPSDRFEDIESASVATYVAVGEPAQVLVTDAGTSLLFIKERNSNRLLWSESLLLSRTRASFVQAIILPENRAAAATNWRNLGISGIDVFVVEFDGDWLRYASQDHIEHPRRTIIVPALDELRDLMGLAAGGFLVTTRFAVFEMDQDGNIVWSVDITDHDEVQGEFATARMLPSGNFVAATYQPGEWLRTHPNHRLHWFRPQGEALIASSGALSRAPRRVEPLGGHGGTGTNEFEAGLSELSEGDPRAIGLTGPITFGGQEFTRGDEIRPLASVQNEDDGPVALRRLEILASAGQCDEITSTDRVLASSEAIALSPGGGTTIESTLLVDDGFDFGSWCAWLDIESLSGERFQVGEPSTFEIVERSTTGGPVTVTPLDINGPRDAGSEMGETLEVVVVTDPEEGCNCRVSRGRSKAPSALVVFGLLIALCCRSRQRSVSLSGWT
jgi:hypothetical protein